MEILKILTNSSIFSFLNMNTTDIDSVFENSKAFYLNKAYEEYKKNSRLKILKNLNRLKNESFEHKLFFEIETDNIVQNLIYDFELFSSIELEEIFNEANLKRELRRYLLELKKRYELIDLSYFDTAQISKRILIILNKKCAKPVRNISFYFRKVFHFKFKNLDDYHSIALSTSA